MTTLREAAPVILGIAAVSVSVIFVAPMASADVTQVPSVPCYDGLTPFDPYANNCAIPSRPAHILGSAPDQTALLNCSVGSQILRALCLSQYVNGGPAPSITLGIG